MNSTISIANRAWLGVLALLVSPAVSAETLLPPAATGRLYVTGSGSNSVFCYSQEGGLLFRFGHEDLLRPRGLAFRSGETGDGAALELHVGSQGAHRVLVFDAEGGYLRQFGVDLVQGPTSLAFAPDGSLYVAAFSTHSIEVFENEIHTRTIEADELRGPNCIAFGPDGAFYVASQLTNRVVRFSASGVVDRTFTGGGLSSPMGIAIRNDELFVTGGASDNVVVFDLDGGFRSAISTQPEISGPQGIAFDEWGSFVTTSFYSGRVAVFGSQTVRVLEDAEIQTGRSVAFEPLARFVPSDFVRGDANRDERVDISDPVSVLAFLFLGAGLGECLDAADADDDGELRITDAIYSLAHLFSGGAPPPAPFPEAGEDPTPDALSCRVVGP